jgi:hypothetical protein
MAEKLVLAVVHVASVTLTVAPPSLLADTSSSSQQASIAAAAALAADSRATYFDHAPQQSHIYRHDTYVVHSQQQSLHWERTASVAISSSSATQTTANRSSRV